MTVVCLGDVMVDVVARVGTPLAIGSDAAGEIRLVGGGSAANTACWLAASGASAALIGCIGTDHLGDWTISELGGLGVELHLARTAAHPTGTCLVLVGPDGERTMVPDTGANAELAVADLPDSLFTAAARLHVSGYALMGAGRAAATDALERARSIGLSISVDAGSSAPLRAVGPQLFIDLVGAGALVFANLDEAQVLTGRTEAPQCARALADQVGAAVVKCGADGAYWSDGSTLEFVPAERITPIDTTGAGDAFAAGMLAALVDDGSVVDALTAGHRLAAQACQRFGGRPAARAGRS